MKNNRLFGLLVIAATTMFSVPTHGALAWSDQFTVSGIAPPPFDSGTIFPPFGGGGYALIASSQKDHQSGTYPVPSLARFDDQGNTLWGLFLDAGASASDVELIGDFDNLNRAFAGHLLGSGVARFGLFQGTSAAAVYARELALAATPENTSLRFFPGSIAGVVQDLTNQFQVLLVNDSGNPALNKSYGSPLFGVPPGGAPGFQFIQNQTLTQLPDRTGYILSAMMSVQLFDSGPPIQNVFSNLFVTACLNNNGTVRWSKSFPLTTGMFPSRDLNVAADGSVVFSVLGGAIEFSTGQTTQRTHLVKLNANGSFAWATTLENVMLPVVNYGPNSAVLLSGSRSASAVLGAPDTDFVMARLNFNTGAVEAQAALRGAGVINGGSIVGSRDDRVYWVMQSAGSFQQINSQTGYVGYVTLNLDQPTVKRYGKAVTFASAVYKPSDLSVLYSPFIAVSASVGAIMMNENLVPARDCALFANDTVQLNNTALTTSALAPTVSDAALTVTDPLVAISPVSFAPTTLALFRAGLCGGTTPTAPNLVITPNQSGGLTLSFASQAGVSYAIQFTGVLGQQFGTVQTLAGTGGTLVYEIPSPKQGEGFYQVLATPNP